MYNNKFIIQYTNDLGELIQIYIAYKDYSGSVTELVAATDCLTVKNTGGDEDKLFNICGLEAYLKFHIPEDDSISIDDFISEHDLDIQVSAFMNGQADRSIFQGFVVVEDNNEPFLDPPYVVEIRALDCLGLLKGVYFLDADGNPFSGKMSILGWLCQILYQTGQTLKLRTYFNLRNTSFANSGNPMEQAFIDIITFSEGSQTPVGDTDPADFSTGFVDYFTALDYITRNCRAKLFQENGCWHFVNLFEYINPDGYTYYEYDLGVPVSGIVPFTQTGAAQNENYDVIIAKKDVIMPIKTDQVKYLKLAYKSVELVYNYDQSLNKICNQDFAQGESNSSYDEVISSSIIDPSIFPVVNFNTFGYDAYCFDTFDGTIIDTVLIAAYPVNPATGQIFIREIQDELGYTTDRFLVIKQIIGNVPVLCRSQKMLIDVNDIIQVSLTWRLRNANGSGTFPTCFIYLYGDDGSHWAMNSLSEGNLPGNPTTWFPVDANFRNTPTSEGSFFCSSQAGESSNIWRSPQFNVTHLTGDFFAKAPVSGQIEIIFISDQSQPAGQEVWIKDWSVTLLPYLKGAYRRLKGDYNFSSQTNNIKQTIKETVEISDSPKRYFKGALLSSATGLVLLPPSWTIPGLPGSLFRFTQAMEYIIFSHIYRMLYKIEGTFKGFVYIQPDLIITRMAGILNTFYFPDSKWPDKRFMCTSFERDYNTGQWRGVFVETRKDINDLGIKLPDSFIFAYLFQSS